MDIIPIHFGFINVHNLMHKLGSHDDFIWLLDYWFKVVMIFYLEKVHYIHVLKYYINKFMFVILYKKMNEK